ncbi:MAG: TetM/TetW/TetO/TetS family tetracycline resistance ribosomal protection protein, partial [Clostridia bacterium]|nr:TetM/TetW/TetO/TetS family tetracycline resistance ribosomal protection protein [Clostridia bacterium]
ASLTWRGTRINLIDTPGHVDFASEVERSLAVLDLGILIVSAADGFGAQTEILYDALRQTDTPVLFFINKLDRAGSDSAAALREIREKLTKDLILFSEVVSEGAEGAKTRALSLRDERVAETLLGADDALLERYLAGEEIGEEELSALLREKTGKGELAPVFFGSGLKNEGVEALLSYLALYAEPVKNDREHPERLSGEVFRITHDKTMGRIAHVRLYGGTLKNRDTAPLRPANGLGPEETPRLPKISQIRRYEGDRFVDLGEASMGDVVALCGLSDANVSDILGEALERRRVKIAEPLFSVRVTPPTPEVLKAFRELAAEDPRLTLAYRPEEREITVSVTGPIQMEILKVLARERYGLEVSLSDATVIYKETPLKTGFGHEAYTMPKPCWAIIDLRIDPLPRGAGYAFESIVPYKELFYKYQTHIELELPRALKQGVYNWEVTDLKVTLVGGNHHTIHTHPLDFFLATPLALMNGLLDAGTTLLEPMERWRLSADESLIGRVVGDILAMRGSYDSPVIRDGVFTMEARVPAATSMDYAVRLASLSS